ncbi:MAG: cyanophycinase [Pirellula sp.]|jgi:cyanophycinase|nr:cyanophycinase [Pirellula sp.]
MNVVFRTVAIIAFLHLPSVNQVVAADNVLMLPEAKSPKNPPSIVLHGGGVITEDVFEKFIELAGGKDAKIVFVPSAGYRQQEYDSEEAFLEDISDRYGAWTYLERSGQIKSFQFLYTDEPDDSDNEDFVRPLLNATGVWFSGGAQTRLNYRYIAAFPEQTLFQKALIDILERGGVVGGTSAGMAALPEIMTLWQEDDDDGRPASAVAAHGFGLMRGAIVEQHFDTVGGRLERFAGLLRDTKRLNRLAGRTDAGETMIGLAIEESTALIIEGDSLKTMGLGNSHVFIREPELRTLEWYELSSDESAKLRRKPERGTSLIRVKP